MNKKQMIVLGGVAVLLGGVALALAIAKHTMEYRSLRGFHHEGKMENQKWSKGYPGKWYEEGQSRGRGGMKGNQGGGMMVDRGNCVAEDCLAVDGLEYPVSVLPEPVAAALKTALDDEYKALATYEAVIAQYGAVRPFIMISRAEERHISALKSLFDKYGIAVPENSYLGKVSTSGMLAEACQTGVDAEVANASLYKDNLMPVVAAYPDITQVFSQLMTASLEKHLPAFERCRG